MKSEVSSNRKERRPTRPFTPYNVFFQLERERILQEHGEGYAATPPITKDANSLARPPSYRNLILAENWYIAGSKKDVRLFDKSKRRVHGVVTFVELSKHISENWAAVDEEVRKYCTLMSQEDTKRYRIEMAAYIEKHGYEHVKRTYKKRKANVEVKAKAGIISKRTKRTNQLKEQDKVVDNASAAAGKFKLCTEGINHQVHPSQRFSCEITPISRRARDSLITNRTLVPNSCSQISAGIGCCVEITPNFSLHTGAINNNGRTANSPSLYKYGASDQKDNMDIKVDQVQLLRHQVSQDGQNILAICPEISYSNNHFRQRPDPSANIASVPVIDIEPLPFARSDFDVDTTVICRDETPIPFTAHNFDWSFNDEQLGEGFTKYSIENSTPSCPLVKTRMNLVNPTARRISLFDPPSQKSIPDISPLSGCFCFTAKDMEALSSALA